MTRVTCRVPQVRSRSRQSQVERPEPARRTAPITDHLRSRPGTNPGSARVGPRRVLRWSRRRRPGVRDTAPRPRRRRRRCRGLRQRAPGASSPCRSRPPARPAPEVGAASAHADGRVPQRVLRAVRIHAPAPVTRAAHGRRRPPRRRRAGPAPARRRPRARPSRRDTPGPGRPAARHRGVVRVAWVSRRPTRSSR